MPINLATNIAVTLPQPLDARTLVADLAALAAIPTGARYRGMRVTVAADLKTRVWDGSIWVVDGSDGGGSLRTATGTFDGTGADAEFTLAHNLGAPLAALIVEDADGNELLVARRRISDNEHRVGGSFPVAVYRWTAIA